MSGRTGRKFFKLLSNVTSTAPGFMKLMLARQTVVKNVYANKRVGRLYLVRRTDGQAVVVSTPEKTFAFAS
jgi:hypothetical protein